MDFYQRAGIVCRAIPRGTVASYGQIALLCGKPKNARQVGYALNKGRLGEEVPAHRVVNSRGLLSGAAAFDTFDMQKIFWPERAWKFCGHERDGRWTGNGTGGNTPCRMQKSSAHCLKSWGFSAGTAGCSSYSCAARYSYKNIDKFIFFLHFLKCYVNFVRIEKQFCYSCYIIYSIF